MSSENEIGVLLRAAYPVICVYSYEERRVEAAIANIVKSKSNSVGGSTPFFYWSCTEGLVDYKSGKRDEEVAISLNSSARPSSQVFSYCVTFTTTWVTQALVLPCRESSRI